jgi:uncharacterized repeat protein (TIGR03803 family)
MHANRQKVSISKVRKLSVTAAALTLVGVLFILTTTPVHAQIPTPNIVYSFQSGSTDFWEAVGILAQGRDGNLYGAAQRSGANALGGVYKFDPSTQTATLVASFTTYGCVGVTLGFDGNFYGTCQTDGAHGYGYVFKVTPGGELTDIYDFTDADNDADPSTVPVLGANGDLYGTTGVINGACGNVYRVTTTGTYKYISGGAGFCGTTQLSAGSNGNIYGTWNNTPNSGSQGAIFKITSSSTYDEFFDFTETSVSGCARTSPILASNGKLYGADICGGTNDNGAIYSLTANGKTLTDLFNIDADVDGGLWGNNLFQASNGNFYGASFNGADDDGGSFFELTSDNVFSFLVLDNGGTVPYGVAPSTSIMQHTNGTLYGTTSANGPQPGYGEFLSFNINASPFIALVGPVPAAAEGAEVQILGQDFTSSSEVEFGGVKATSVERAGSTFIEAKVPSGALTGPITVTTGSGALSTLVTFDVTPTVSAISPTSGPVGTEVTITGTGLTQATTVEFHGTKATFTVVSDSEITATVPSGATTGAISVTTKGGSAISGTFTVN